MKFKLLLLFALQLFATLIHPMESNNNHAFIEIQCQDAAIQLPISVINQFKTIKNLLRDFPGQHVDVSPLSITARTMEQLMQIMKNPSMIERVDNEDLFSLFDAADKLEVDVTLRKELAQKIKDKADFSNLSSTQKKRFNSPEKSIRHLSNNLIKKIQETNENEINLSNYELESLKGLERFTNPGIWQKLLGILKNPVNKNIKKVDLSNNKLIACDINYIKQLFPNCEYINLQNNNINQVPNSFLFVPGGCTIDLSQNCIHPVDAQKFQQLLQNPTPLQKLRQKISHQIINNGLVVPLIGLPALAIIFVTTDVATVIYLTDRCLELNFNTLEKLLALPFLMGWSVMVAHGATIAATPFILGPTALIDSGLRYIANKYANPFVPSTVIIDAQKKLEPTSNDIKQLKRQFELLHKSNESNGLKDLIYK